ncbi:MAG: hypothetical protein U0946_05025 [Patescibacteria group bacterium]|nr:hypothetical protein [Patescibacteria group bacterium]
MSTKWFLIILLILGGVMMFGVVRKPKLTPAETLSTQSKTMGAVEVEVTPKTLTKGKEAIFKVVLDTHSVNLNYDYKKIITLTDNLGKNYKALKWSGENSGHHLSGDLTFEPFNNQAKSLMLTLDGIDNQKAQFEFAL